MTEGLATNVGLLRQERLEGKLGFHKVEGEVHGLTRAYQVAHALAASKQFRDAVVGTDSSGKSVLMLHDGKGLVKQGDKDGLIQDLHHFAALYSIEINRCPRCAELGGGYRNHFQD